MKSIAIIAIILVVAGAIWFAMKNTDVANAPMVEENYGSDATSTDGMDMTDEEYENMPESEQPGNDVGMELPETGVGANVDTNAKVFDVSGANFAFNQKEIRVKEGDTVIVNFTSTDGFHDWVLDEFNAKTARVQTGMTSSVTFVANKKGTFEYYCSVGSHRQQGMVGKLIVE